MGLIALALLLPYRFGPENSEGWFADWTLHCFTRLLHVFLGYLLDTDHCNFWKISSSTSAVNTLSDAILRFGTIVN